MKTVSVTAVTVRNAVAEARRQLGIDPRSALGQEKIRSGGEDGLYRVTLHSGDVVEIGLRRGGPTEVHEVVDHGATA
jgi:hypothetical protein